MHTVYLGDSVVKFLTNLPELITGPEVLVIREISPRVFTNLIENLENSLENKLVLILHPDPEKAFGVFASCFHGIEAAGGMVLGQDDKLLMIYRLSKWDLPKGKIEPGENPEQAAIREVEEECGIKKLRIISRLNSTYHIYKLKGERILKKTYWFKMGTVDTGSLVPQTEEDIEIAGWFGPAEVSEHLKNTYPAIRELVAANYPD